MEVHDYIRAIAPALANQDLRHRFQLIIEAYDRLAARPVAAGARVCSFGPFQLDPSRRLLLEGNKKTSDFVPTYIVPVSIRIEDVAAPRRGPRVHVLARKAFGTAAHAGSHRDHDREPHQHLSDGPRPGARDRRHAADAGGASLKPYVDPIRSVSNERR
jgi:hypothetical protein